MSWPKVRGNPNIYLIRLKLLKAVLYLCQVLNSPLLSFRYFICQILRGNCVISIKGTKARTGSLWQRKIKPAFAFKVKGLNHKCSNKHHDLGDLDVC